MHVQDCTCSEDVIYTTDGIEMEYAKDLLTAAGSLLAKTIKVRHSRTRGGDLLSCGCYRCDALFGPSYIAEEIMAIVAANAVQKMPIIVRQQRPQLEYLLLDAMRNAGQ